MDFCCERRAIQKRPRRHRREFFIRVEKRIQMTFYWMQSSDRMLSLKTCRGKRIQLCYRRNRRMGEEQFASFLYCFRKPGVCARARLREDRGPLCTFTVTAHWSSSLITSVTTTASVDKNIEMRNSARFIQWRRERIRVNEKVVDNNVEIETANSADDYYGCRLPFSLLLMTASVWFVANTAES